MAVGAPAHRQQRHSDSVPCFLETAGSHVPVMFRHHGGGQLLLDCQSRANAGVLIGAVRCWAGRLPGIGLMVPGPPRPLVAPCAHPPTQAGRAWSIGERHREAGCVPIGEQADYDAIADRVRERLAPDVVAFQVVENMDAGTRVFPAAQAGTWKCTMRLPVGSRSRANSMATAGPSTGSTIRWPHRRRRHPQRRRSPIGATKTWNPSATRLPHPSLVEYGHYR